MSYFDCSDAEGVDFGDWVEEHEEDRRYMASLEEKGPWGDEDPGNCLCGRDCRECRGDCGFPACQCECNVDAADGGEEDDDMEGRDFHPDEATAREPDESQLYAEALHIIRKLNENRLAGLIKAGEAELRERFEKHTELAKAAKLALDRKKPRATRSDAGKPRAPKVSNGNAEAKEGAA